MLVRAHLCASCQPPFAGQLLLPTGSFSSFPSACGVDLQLQTLTCHLAQLDTSSSNSLLTAGEFREGIKGSKVCQGVEYLTLPPLAWQWVEAEGEGGETLQQVAREVVDVS